MMLTEFAWVKQAASPTLSLGFSWLIQGSMWSSAAV